MLRGALSGHHVQYNDAPQDAFLHGQSHHPVHGHLFPHHPHLLPPVRLRRKGTRGFRSMLNAPVHLLCRSMSPYWTNSNHMNDVGIVGEF